MYKKSLLILDINGLIVYKTDHPTTGEMLKLSSYYVVIRPGIREHLADLYARYTIGWFTSTTEKNAIRILQHILTPEQISETLFFWYRDRTRPDDKKGEHHTLKCLDDVWDEFPMFHAGNTLIVDDENDKLRLNPKRCCLVVNPYQGDDATLHNIVDVITTRLS